MKQLLLLIFSSFLFLSFDAEERAGYNYQEKAEKEFQNNDFEAALNDYYRALYFGVGQNTHYRIGQIYEQQKKLHDAILQYKEALRANPGYLPAYTQLGGVYERMGKLEDAEKIYLEALAFNAKFSIQTLPQTYEDAKLDKADAYRMEEIQKLKDADLSEATVLVYADSSVESTLFAARYLPKLKGKVIFHPAHELEKLFQSSFPHISQTETEHNFKISIEALPYLFFQDKNEFVPYLKATRPAEFDEWIAKNPPRIGIAWQPSLSLKDFSSLTSANYYALQESKNQEEWLQVATKLDMTDLIGEDDTLDDIAAAITHLDLVISAPNRIALLSAALGKRTIVLLPDAESNWFWRNANFWYPTMTIIHGNKLPQSFDVLKFLGSGNNQK